MTQLFLASIDSTSVESLYLAQQHDRILEIASKPKELQAQFRTSSGTVNEQQK
jgi:hypothetical protein